jgi:hypothetical protein
MVELKLTPEEATALQRVLQAVAIRERTGEIGVIHGLERFVSTQVTLKRHDLELLDSIARKVGLVQGLRRVLR